MPAKSKVTRIGILGCGAIGSRLAKSCSKELKGLCRLSALYDIDAAKAKGLAGSNKRLAQTNLTKFFKACDLVVEATSAEDTADLIRKGLSSGRHVLVMSVGKLLGNQDLFSLAAKKRCQLLVPSGAIAGIDAVKAASLASVDQVTLTTRKPMKGLGLDPSQIKEETIVFEGSVDEAVKLFPRNINVAATIALAMGDPSKLTVRILTSPDFERNAHEIEITGAFGRMVSRTENAVCEDNPKTSFLAVLSAIQTLKDFCRSQRIGT